MSADELRQAAATLRERAEATTHPGHGWRLADLAGANEVWADRGPAGFDAFMVATTATRLNPNPGTRGHSDAAYIATVHPGVGLALADWLDATADEIERREWPRSRTSGTQDRALAVARLIIGGAA
jgi:hypothetical protein